MQVTKEQLRTWDKQNYWHAFTQMSEYEPFIVERAHAATLVDIEGKEYLDGVSSLWCNVHGHGHPKINAAIIKQLEKVAHFTSLGASHPTAIQLAKRLADIAPGDLEHVFFSSDGASSVEVALKMAFQYWQQCENPEPARTKYIALGEAYHGDTLGSVSVGDIKVFHAKFAPLMFEVVRTPSPNLRKLPERISPENALNYFLEEADKVFSQHAGEIAAFIIEPLVQGAAGMIMHPQGYLQGIRELCTKHNVLLIADEVATGFGRTGTMFACEQENVTPDILCLGKGISGGYLPLAATIATGRIWKAFLGTASEQKTLYHGHTYSGNPLSCAAALASLDLFDKEKTLDTLRGKIARLNEGLARLAGMPHVADVRNRGFMAAIELVDDKQTNKAYAPDRQIGKKVCQAALQNSLWLRPLGDVIVIMPPFCISDDELDQLLQIVEASIQTVTNQ